MQNERHRILDLVGLIVVAALNVAVVSFYVLWSIADSAAINQAETATSVDPSLLMPNANQLWLAAHGSLLALLALDAVVIGKAVNARSKGSPDGRGRKAPAHSIIQ